jgi:hypothetical protein
MQNGRVALRVSRKWQELRVLLFLLHAFPKGEQEAITRTDPAYQLQAIDLGRKRE